MDIEQLEALALAEDRGEALAQLIPGTEDYYFYSCLAHQHRGELGEVRRLVDAWVKRHGETERVREIRDRQALLGHTNNPASTLEHLRRRTGLTFDHQREIEGAPSELPTRLDPAWIGREAFRRDAFEHHQNLDGFSDRALDWLCEDEQLSLTQIRALLGRLRRPDVPRVVELIGRELDDRHSSGFGSLPIHSLLTLAQLDALARARPSLLHDQRFVAVRLARLLPGPDVDLDSNHEARRAHLDALWAFVEPLPAAFNSLRLHVLYHRLDFDRRRGAYMIAPFERYLALPRQAHYVADSYARTHDKALASYGQDFSSITGLPTVYDDGELVRDYLLRLFAAPEFDNPQRYRTLLDDRYVRRVFAEAKILAGVGDQERWYSLLDDPAAYAALKQRVDIEFTHDNQRSFDVDEPVELRVDIKNVPALVVKVFEINTLAYFSIHGRAVDTSVDLDGLVANDERVIEYGEPPLRRVHRKLRFDQLTRPGTYVIELIGGGKSSRALIHKGALRYVERLGAAGHVLTVLDEQDRLVPAASVLFGGREYTADEHGDIRIPYGAGSNDTILLRSGHVTTVANFRVRPERYALAVGVHVEREQLLAGRTAEVLIRAALTLNGVPVPSSLLSAPTLTIHSSDRHGTSSSVTVPLELGPGAEATHAFKVPEALQSLRFEVRAKVRSVSEQRDIELTGSHAIGVNLIDTLAEVAGLHLEATSAGYRLAVLGKSGEPRAGLQVNVRLEHQDFRAQMQVALQTDARGLVELGELDGIVSLWAWLGTGGRAHWQLPRAAASLPALVQVPSGERVCVPLLVHGHDQGHAASPVRSLLERRGSGYLRDCIEAARVEDGALWIDALEPGDYELVLEPDRRVIQLRVAGPNVVREWALSAGRHLQCRRPEPLRVAAIDVDAQAVKIRVAGHDPSTRVHVFATRFVAGHDAHAELDGLRLGGPESASVGRSRCHYLSGRDIGDEYRYILERRRATPLAGTMLERPGLLLNPWALRTTSTGRQDAKGGRAYDAYASEPAPRMSAPAPARPAPQAAQAPTNNLDFLADAAFVALNLELDEHGVIEIDRAQLTGRSLITVVAAGERALVSRHARLPAVEVAPLDLRLRDGLDPARHFVKRKRRAGLAPGELLVLDDPSTAKLETIDSVAKAHALLLTLSNDAHLREFEFVTRWPSLSPDEQRAKYSKYACHELSLFLARKDPGFFAAVVQPYLAHKRDKTFLDHYLLGHDLSAWLEPWAYAQLNALERILLGERVVGEAGPGARHIADRVDLLPPDVEGDNAAFDTALQGSALSLDTSSSMLVDVELEEGGGGSFGGASFGALSGAVGGGAPPMPAAAPAAMAPPRAPGAPPPPPASPARKMAKRGRAREEAKAEIADLEAREQVQRLYRAADKTEEWAENNYYRRKLAEQGPSLIRVNAFWLDFARHVEAGGGAPFLSGQFVRATSCFAEMMCALSLLDLPFAAEAPTTTRAALDAGLELRARTALIAFYEQIAAVEPSGRSLGVLVSQHYFRADDRYRFEGNERHDKYVDGELLVHTVYICQVVLTNPSSSAHKLELLLQIPRGAMPVANGSRTRDVHVHLPPHGTHAIEYSFYFPHAGSFEHFPVHVAKHAELVAFTQPTTLEVLTKPRSVDTGSWSHVSQHGSSEELLAYLDAHNLERLDLSRIAWRMRERAVFEAVVAVLTRRHVYEPTLWSYAIHHGDVAQIGVYLRQQDAYLRGCGLAIDSPLVTSEPISRRWYEHLEYAPLINARAHQLGERRQILNDALASQYRAFLQALCYAPRPSDDQLVEAAYYVFLQDRAAEGLALLARVDASRVTGRLQYDYLCAYAALLDDDPATARALAEPWREHPVDRWRKRYAALLAALDEAEGAGVEVIDADSREQEQAKLAAGVASFDIEIEGSKLTIHHQNLRSCTLSCYRMDIELLFSRAPFMKNESRRFSIVTPNHSETIELPADQQHHTVELPAAYRNANTIIEVLGGGVRRSQANYAHALAVQLIEPYGQLRVRTRSEPQRPLARAYVKVYARKQDGSVGFFKDGYTDLRGAFDYATLSTDELDRVERFAILVMSDEHGALIREAAPPQR